MKLSIRHLFLVMFIVGASIASYLYWLAERGDFQEKKIVNGKMSARAEEYVKKKQQQGDFAWNLTTKTAETEESEVASRNIFIEGCLRLVSPFSVKSLIKEENCNVLISTKEPVGGITIFSDPRKDQWQDIGHIFIRRQDTTKYTEETYKVGDAVYLIFSVNDPYVFQKTAFIPVGEKVYAITIDISTSQSYDAEFKQLLDSIVWVQ